MLITKDEKKISRYKEYILVFYILCINQYFFGELKRSLRFQITTELKTAIHLVDTSIVRIDL